MRIYKPSEAKKLIGCSIEYEHISGGPTFGPVEVHTVLKDELVVTHDNGLFSSLLLCVTLIQPLQFNSEKS